ncbi:sigma factor-like helix-turn-helix DNA-binding protein [Streptomyces sp. NRRL S-87]|uniref:sigma factor-like helix-turn-helix DNA-binding protein n=1 Tax=Streptomyces sp. NRRL S-87 TaxID=1463920 RepID=UPI0004BF6771|nr:sigma factor-like helix-turn-helix DNA-binding protein [Streptomyces sp. NRRL S-87]
MTGRWAGQGDRRAREFEAFVAGAGGRLLHVATLLTAEPDHDNPAARRLLADALARTYAGWERARGDDPYDRTRAELALAFARSAWRHHRGRGGVLTALAPQERLVITLRVYEGIAEEQTAALLGLPADRIRTLLTRAVSALRSRPATPAAGAA